jgi:hypothetical protein
VSERHSFEVRVGGIELMLNLHNCCAVLFRNCVEVDYLAIDSEENENQTIRIFNNPEFVRWMAGYEITNKAGEIQRTPVSREVEPGVRVTFREFVSADGGEPWSPPIVEREEPNEREMEMFLDLNAGDMESELKELLGE